MSFNFVLEENKIECNKLLIISKFIVKLFIFKGDMLKKEL